MELKSMSIFLSFLPSNGQTIFWDWFTLIFLLIIAIGVFVGIKKGLLSMLVGVVGVLAVIVISCLIAKPVGEWFASSTGLGSSLTNSIYDWLVGQNSIFSAVINKSEVSSSLDSYLTSVNIPTMFFDTIKSVVIPLVPDVGVDPIGLYIAKALSQITFTAGAFFVLSLFLGIIVGILKRLTKGINKIPLIGWINRIGGGLVGAIYGGIIISLVCYALSFFTSMPQIGSFIVDTLCLADQTKWSIGKMIFEENFIQQFINYLIASI